MNDELTNELAVAIGKRVSFPSLHWRDFGHKDAHLAIAETILPIIAREVAAAMVEQRDLDAVFAEENAYVIEGFLATPAGSHNIAAWLKQNMKEATK